VSASAAAAVKSAASVEPAASTMEPSATGAAAKPSAAETPAASEPSNASTTNVVRVRNGPGSASTGCVARMVSRPEVSTVAGAAVAVATVSKTVAKVRSSVRIPR
jgi:hypothetical protein